MPERDPKAEYFDKLFGPKLAELAKKKPAPIKAAEPKTCCRGVDGHEPNCPDGG